jgi:uncharacterized OB-fold protein
MTERVLGSPEPTVDTQKYWAAAGERKLMIGKCRSCGELHFYPRTRCPKCLSAETELVQASGKGTIYSYSVMRRAKIPYAIAYVALEEGVTMMTNIVGTDLDRIEVGMPVRVAFQPSANGTFVPVFEPA